MKNTFIITHFKMSNCEDEYYRATILNDRTYNDCYLECYNKLDIEDREK